MSRTLGSFNRRVNLPPHPMDWQRQSFDYSTKDPQAMPSYDFGLFINKEEPDVRTPTNEEKFYTGFGGKRIPGVRMAGDAFTDDIKQSTGMPKGFTLPTIGLAEIRNLADF